MASYRRNHEGTAQEIEPSTAGATWDGDLGAIRRLLRLKSQLWQELPDVPDGSVEHAQAAARFFLICQVCEIFGVNG